MESTSLTKKASTQSVLNIKKSQSSNSIWSNFGALVKTPKQEKRTPINKANKINKKLQILKLDNSRLFQSAISLQQKAANQAYDINNTEADQVVLDEQDQFWNFDEDFNHDNQPEYQQTEPVEDYRIEKYDGRAQNCTVLVQQNQNNNLLQEMTFSNAIANGHGSGGLAQTMNLGNGGGGGGGGTGGGGYQSSRSNVRINNKNNTLVMNITNTSTPRAFSMLEMKQLKTLLVSRKILSQDEREYLESYIVKGFPADLRGRLWRVSSGAQLYLDDKQFQNYYHTLIDDYPLFPDPCIYQIELDMVRSFPDDSFFQQPEIINSMKRICIAYTKRNPVVGYVQGMNYIVGRLIKHLTEEETFWVFAMLIETILPIDYYIKMVGIQTDVKAFQELLKDCLPQVYKKFQQQKFDPALSSFGWFSCLFTEKLDEEVVSSILDMILLKGGGTIHQIALALLHNIEPQIIQCSDFSQLYQVIESYPSYIKSATQLLTSAMMNKKSKNFTIPSFQQIESVRAKCYQQTLTEQMFCEPDITGSTIECGDTNNKSQNQHNSSNQQFFNKFYLFTGLLKLKNCEKYRDNKEIFQLKNQQNQTQQDNQQFQSFEEQIVNNYKCDQNWPVCLYDFTFKFLYTQYFCFKVADPPTIIENYFGVIQSPKKDTQDYTARFLSLEDISKNFDPQPFQRLNRTSDTIDAQVQDLNELQKGVLLNRGKHYCQNHNFVKRFKELYKLDDPRLLENSHLTGSSFIPIMQSQTLMHDFIHEISHFRTQYLLSLVSDDYKKKNVSGSSSVAQASSGERKYSSPIKRKQKQPNQLSNNQSKESQSYKINEQEYVQSQNLVDAVFQMNKQKFDQKRSISNKLQSPKKSSMVDFVNDQLQKANEEHQNNNIFSKLRKQTIQDMICRLDELIVKENSSDLTCRSNQKIMSASKHLEIF